MLSLSYKKKQHETPFLHMVENIIKDNFDKFHPVMQYKKYSFRLIVEIRKEQYFQ